MAMSRLRSAAPWLALALLVLCGGELAALQSERLLGVHRYEDLTAQVLVAIVAVRSLVELSLAAFGVYAILQLPLASIGWRIPKTGALVAGAVIGVLSALLFPRVVQELHLHGTYALQYILYVLSQATGPTAVAAILVLLLLGPIVEEVVFRGIILEGLLRTTSSLIAVIASAAIFAGMHAVGGAGQMSAAFLCGLVQGWLYWRTRSILPGAVTHVVYDTIVFYPVVFLMLHHKHA